MTEPASLDGLLRRELLNIPLEHWGYFFPMQLAVWRYLRGRRPALLGELEAGYDQEPYFKGRGSDWFCTSLGNDLEYLDLLEAIMYPLVDALPRQAHDRGFVRSNELPDIDAATVARLEEIVLDRADRAIRVGLAT